MDATRLKRCKYVLNYMNVVCKMGMYDAWSLVYDFPLIWTSLENASCPQLATSRALGVTGWGWRVHAHVWHVWRKNNLGRVRRLEFGSDLLSNVAFLMAGNCLKTVRDECLLLDQGRSFVVIYFGNLFIVKSLLEQLGSI